MSRKKDKTSSLISRSVGGCRVVMHNLPIELRVKRDRRRFEIDLPDKLARLLRSVFAVHAGVFPFDRQRALVPDIVEGDDDFFEVNIAVAEGAEVPVSARISEGRMPAEDADFAAAVAPPDVLHV